MHVSDICLDLRQFHYFINEKLYSYQNVSFHLNTYSINICIHVIRRIREKMKTKSYNNTNLLKDSICQIMCSAEEIPYDILKLLTMLHSKLY